MRIRTYGGGDGAREEDAAGDVPVGGGGEGGVVVDGDDALVVGVEDDVDQLFQLLTAQARRPHCRGGGGVKLRQTRLHFNCG